jgi:peroxin-19
MKTEEEEDLDAMLDSTLDDFLKTVDGPTNNSNNTNFSSGNQNTPLEMDPELAETLKRLSESAEKLNDFKTDGGFENLMEQFEKNSNYKGMVEGFMKQLITKEILYEPMKALFDKYPEWLEQNKDKIKPEEYDNYLKQYGYIEKIVFTYDTQGEEGFEEVLKAVQEMQECGQVPIDIVKGLAPEVEFDEEGLPKFPATQGIPGLEGMNPENCTLF